MLEESRNNYTAAIYLEGERCGVCFCDLSTGEVYATACSGEDCLTHLMNELGRFEPREVVLSPEAWENTALSQAMELKLDCRREFGSVKRFDYVVAGTAASNQFENYQVIPADRPEALQAVGGLLSYLYETQKTSWGICVSCNTMPAAVHGAGFDCPPQSGADRDFAEQREAGEPAMGAG